MSFTPITNKKLSDKVVNIIKQQIKEGILKPGEKLPNELELAEELGVSRGILREALTILQAEKYVCRKQKEGTFVNQDVQKLMNYPGGISLKKATYPDLIEMRECIEKKAVEKIIDVAAEDQLQELFYMLKGEVTVKETALADFRFHHRLAELSQNAMFVNFLDTYYDVMDNFIKTENMQEKYRTEIAGEHMEIVKAIQKRDKEQAEQAVERHFCSLRKRIKEIE